MKRFLGLMMTACVSVGLLGTTAAAEARTDLTVALSAAYPTLDPNYYPTDISRLVMEDLVAMNYSTGEIVPSLAETWEVSEDGLVWTLELRDDVTFHDGTPFTAEDVLYSAQLCAEGPNAYSYEGVTFEANGDYEVVVTLPDYTNLRQYDLNIPIVNAKKHQELGEVAYYEQMIGTGPYMMESYDSATGVAVLKRNDNYWGEKAKLEQITFRVITDQSTTLIALEKGEVDFAQIDSSVYSTAKNSDKLDVVFGPPILAYTLVYNTNAYPASEKEFRQAVNYAIDKEMIAAVSEVEGNYEIADSFYASVWGEKPENIGTYEYNPEKAKELLEGMGLELPYDLGTISILPDHKNMMEVIQQNLAEVGLTFKIEMLESVAHRDVLRSDNFILGITAGTDVNVAPVWTFYSYFNSAMNPYSKYQDETIDAISDVVYTAVNQDEVKDAMKQLMVEATEENLYNILFLNGRIFAHTDGLVPDMSDSRNRHFENYYWEE